MTDWVVGGPGRARGDGSSLPEALGDLCRVAAQGLREALVSELPNTQLPAARPPPRRTLYTSLTSAAAAVGRGPSPAADHTPPRQSWWWGGGACAAGHRLRGEVRRIPRARATPYRSACRPADLRDCVVPHTPASRQRQIRAWRLAGAAPPRAALIFLKRRRLGT